MSKRQHKYGKNKRAKQLYKRKDKQDNLENTDLFEKSELANEVTTEVLDVLSEESSKRHRFSEEEFPGDIKRKGEEKEEISDVTNSDKKFTFESVLDAIEFKPRSSNIEPVITDSTSQNSLHANSPGVDGLTFIQQHRETFCKEKTQPGFLHAKAIPVSEVEGKQKIVIPRTGRGASTDIFIDVDNFGSREELIISAMVPANFTTNADLKQYEDLLKCLIFYINPLARDSTNENILNDLLEAAVITKSAVTSEDTGKVVEEKLNELGIELLKYWRFLISFKFARKGYCAHEYTEHFPSELKEIDGYSESDKLDNFITDVLNSGLPVTHLKEMIEKERYNTNLINELIKCENREELEKMKVFYAANPHVRLEHHEDVTKEEILELVSISVRSDYGVFLWLVREKPAYLLGDVAIVDSVIEAIHQKLLSKDSRPMAALITIIPEMLKSLKDDELSSLSAKYIVNEDIKVGNWVEVFYSGYLMSLSNQEKGEKKKSNPNSCVITAKIEMCTTAEELVYFLIFCALIAELGGERFPTMYDNSTDPFCHRILRCLIENTLVPQKKKMLLEAILLMPNSIKSRIFAEGEYPLSTSIYDSLNFFKKSVFARKVDRSGYINAIKILSNHISIARIVKEFILPDMTTSNALHAGLIWEELMTMEEFKEEVASNLFISIEELVNLALNLYEKPDPEGKNRKRFGFIENLLNFVDKIVERKLEDKNVLNSINKTLSSRKFEWYEHLTVLSICFPKTRKKLKQPTFPSIECSIESLKAAKLTGVIYSWPDIEKAAPVFDSVIDKNSEHLDNAKIAFILASTLIDETLSKGCIEFMNNYLDRMYESPRLRATQIPTESIHRHKRWMQEVKNTANLDKYVQEAVFKAAAHYKYYCQLVPLSYQKKNTGKTLKKSSPESSAKNPKEAKRQSEKNNGRNSSGGRVRTEGNNKNKPPTDTYEFFYDSCNKDAVKHALSKDGRLALMQNFDAEFFTRNLPEKEDFDNSKPIVLKFYGAIDKVQKMKEKIVKRFEAK